MKRQPRLSRSAVLAGLRDHAAKHGFVSAASLAKRDPGVLRSLHLYFPNFEAARRAARVPVARPAALVRVKRRRRKPKSSVRRGPGRRWNAAVIVLAIQERARKAETLASSKVPPRLVAAARWHFGSWPAALAAAGVAADDVRLQRRPYTKADILALVRRLARDGTPLRASTLKGVVKLDTVRKLFGSVDAAIRAAGFEYVPRTRRKWSHERVIDELRSRAKAGKLTLTRGLGRAVQLYFGGAHAARVAAGIPILLRAPWTRESLIKELQRRARRGDSGSTLWAACKRLFGSVALARRAAGVPATQRKKGMAAWDQPALLAELRRRIRKRQPLGRGLTEGLRRQFGSLTRARALAAVPANRNVKAMAAPSGTRRATAGPDGSWRSWSREQVIEKLRVWRAGGGGRLRADVSLACKHHFGSVARALDAANLPRDASPWTPGRIRQALGEPGFDVLDPAFVAACIYHFGSVTAARASAERRRRRRTWSKTTVIAELQARARRGLKGVGRLLRAPAVRLFGSTEAALRVAAQTDPHRSPGAAERRWAARSTKRGVR